MCPDNVYGLEVAVTSENSPERRLRPVVGFAPMPFPDPDPRGRAKEDQIFYEEFIRKLADFASWLIGQSYTITFFGTDIGVDPVAVEDVQMALLSGHGIAASQYRVSNSVKSTEDLLDTMSEMDYVITCRFHGVVFSHLLNKPVLAIAHHPKVTDAMADLELSNYCVDIGGFDLKQLTEKFSSMVINADEIKTSMSTSLTRNRQRLTSYFDELFSRWGVEGEVPNGANHTVPIRAA